MLIYTVKGFGGLRWQPPSKQICMAVILYLIKQKNNMVNQMTQTEFLEKYGNENLEFSNMYKYRVIYKNKELGIWCSGIIEYRSSIDKIETVNSISQENDFDFGFIEK